MQKERGSAMNYKSMKLFGMLALIIGAYGTVQALGEVRLGVHGGYTAGGDIENSDVAYGAQVELGITPNLGVEVAVSRFSDEAKEQGVEIELDYTSIAASLVWRADLSAPLGFFILGGFNYNIVDGDAKLDSRVFGNTVAIDFDLDNAVGFHVGAGLNIALADNLELFTEYRYTFLDLEGKISARSQGVVVEESIDGSANFGIIKFGINLMF
jgi:opacity protein-like surface antigen